MIPRAGACWIILLAALLAACAGSSYKPTPEKEAIRRGVVLDALGQIGRPYRYGGKTPEAGEVIDLDDALPGDLLFYSISGRRVDHVSIYLGDGQAVHAPSSGKHVIVKPTSNKWWSKRFVDAVRIIQ